MSDSYVDQVLGGDAPWTDIDDFVERWHAGGTGVALREFLGFSREEYALWVEQAGTLRLILAARQRGVPVLELIEQASHEHALAARGGLTPDQARTVEQWLRDTGRLPAS